MQQDTLSKLINNPLIDHLNKERETIERISTLSGYSKSVQPLFSSPGFSSALSIAEQNAAILKQNENAIKQMIHGVQAVSSLWSYPRDTIANISPAISQHSSIFTSSISEQISLQQHQWDFIRSAVSDAMKISRDISGLNKIADTSLSDTINIVSSCLNSYSEQFSALREKQRLNAVTNSWFASNPPIKPIISELTLPQYAELTSSLSDFSYWDKADDDILMLHNAYYSGSLSNNEITASCSELVHNPHNIKSFLHLKEREKSLPSLHIVLVIIGLIFGPLFAHGIDYFWQEIGAFEAIESIIDDTLLNHNNP